MKLASLVLAIMMLLTACGGSNKGGSGSNGSDSGKTTAGKDYVLIKNTDLMSMDSAKATDSMSFEVLANCYGREGFTLKMKRVMKLKL